MLGHLTVVDDLEPQPQLALKRLQDGDVPLPDAYVAFVLLVDVLQMPPLVPDQPLQVIGGHVLDWLQSPRANVIGRSFWLATLRRGVERVLVRPLEAVQVRLRGGYVLHA